MTTYNYLANLNLGPCGVGESGVVYPDLHPKNTLQIQWMASGGTVIGTPIITGCCHWGGIKSIYVLFNDTYGDCQAYPIFSGIEIDIGGRQGESGTVYLLENCTIQASVLMYN